MDANVDVYFKPWTRGGPYVLGVFLAFVMLKFKKPKIPILLVVIGWILAIGLGFAVIYLRWIEVGENVKRWSKEVALTYYTTHRPIWGLCICWVIWACHSGYGGIINKFLSFRYFVPISKISFGIYLFHWGPQLSFYRSQKFSREISLLNLVSSNKVYELNI